MASNTNVITVPMFGGLNVAVSDQMIAPGECTELNNFEITTTGRYQRVSGYERYSGKPAPSSVIAAELQGFPFETPDLAIAAIKNEQSVRREAIEPVPGSGPILGVLMFNGVVYAFRNIEDGSAAKMYKESDQGWVAVDTPPLSPNGYYEFRESNFTGSAGTREVIGVDGKNPAFRWDGHTFTQITTSVPPDTPIHCEILPSQVLLLAFRGGSFLFSAVGEPTKFEAVDGGGEIAVGGEITGMELQAEGTCAIFTREKTYILYGTSKADYQLKSLALKSGAIEHSIQQMSTAIYLDDRGLTKLNRVQEFGNFDAATISQKIQPLLLSKLHNVTSSIVIRKKNQYRLFFSDRTCLCLTEFGGEVLGFSQLRLTFLAYCTWSGENSAGVEKCFAGGDDGYIYQLDSGNSFDGHVYSSSLQTGFLSLNQPEYKKRWRKLVVECDSVTQLQAQYKCYYDFADPNTPISDVLLGSGSKWDQSDWDFATWGGAVTSWSDLYIDGVSRNIAVYMRSESDFYPPHRLSQIILHASPRGRRR